MRPKTKTLAIVGFEPPISNARNKLTTNKSKECSFVYILILAKKQSRQLQTTVNNCVTRSQCTRMHQPIKLSVN